MTFSNSTSSPMVLSGWPPMELPPMENLLKADGEVNFTGELSAQNKVPHVAFYSLLIFSAIRWLIENFTSSLWPDFARLKHIHRRDWAMRWTSMIHSMVTTYNAYQCLVDPLLYANRFTRVTDQHYFTAAVSLGYFAYDTFMVFTDIEAEKEAGGLCQTVLHHLIVLAIMPIGLVYNTMAWYGSGVYFFWGEITGFNMNMIWIMRTAGYESTMLYILNGLVFSLSFIAIRTVVLGYYMYLFMSDVMAHPEFCQNTIPSVEQGACRWGVGLLFGVYLLGWSWVPAVVKKVLRALHKILDAPSEARDKAVSAGREVSVQFSPRKLNSTGDFSAALAASKHD